MGTFRQLCPLRQWQQLLLPSTRFRPLAPAFPKHITAEHFKSNQPQLVGHRRRHVFMICIALEHPASQHARPFSGTRVLGILQANPLSKAAHGSSPGVPRSIRSRTGQTTDPIPAGMHLEDKKCALPPSTCAAGFLLTPLQYRFTMSAEESDQTEKLFMWQ